MKSTGIVRRVDELGRIVLPKELRDTLYIKEKDPIEILVDGEDIVLHKFARGCVFCGSEEAVFDFFDRPVCEACAHQIAEGLREGRA